MDKLLRIVRSYPWVVATILVGLAVLVAHLAGAPEVGKWIAVGYVGAFVLWTAVDMVRDMLKGNFGLDILALVAMVSTLAVGEYIASLIVVLMITGGEALEDFAAARAQRDLSALLDNAPRSAHILEGGADATEPAAEPTDSDAPELSDASIRDVDVDEVRIGDRLLVRPSEVVPVDGVLLSEGGSFDESSLTGESLPVSRSAGEEVLSGAVNGQRAVVIRAEKTAADSQFQQIVALVADAEKAKAPIVRLADRYAVPFTIISLLIAGIAWWVSGTPMRFAEVLVLATPCPLLIAAPVAFIGGQAQASRRGMVVKGGAVLESLSRVRTALFDKTGTLTRGRPELAGIVTANGFDEEEVLRLAASAEQYSAHVLATGVVRAARERDLRLLTSEDAHEEATNGVRAQLEGRLVVVGKESYIESFTGAFDGPDLHAGHAAAHVAVGGRYAGTLLLADGARPEAAETIRRLREAGVERIGMLTGDVAPTAEHVAAELGIDEVHASLLPKDKVDLAAKADPRPVMMVGDGVNDAPVLASADVGIAMGAAGSTAAGEAADGVILRDSIAPVGEIVVVARHTVRVALTAIWMGILISIGLMLIATTGAIPAIAGALLQEVVDLVAILYALRALSTPKGLDPVPSRKQAARQAREARESSATADPEPDPDADAGARPAPEQARPEDDERELVAAR